MPTSDPTLLIAVVDRAAVVKVNGRANFTTSVSFKRLFGELRDRGFESFVLDLTDCITMDSTFLGVLAGTALKLVDLQRAKLNGSQKNSPDSGLCLLNPSQRVVDLLDNLGVSDLFRTTKQEMVTEEPGALKQVDTLPADRTEVTETCLEAHRLLMKLNPDNIPKFKDVAQFLAEDLDRLRHKVNKDDLPPQVT